MVLGLWDSPTGLGLSRGSGKVPGFSYSAKDPAILGLSQALGSLRLQKIKPHGVGTLGQS